MNIRKKLLSVLAATLVALVGTSVAFASTCDCSGADDCSCKSACECEKCDN